MKVVYLQIIESIRKKINDGDYPINSLLPSEKILAQEYQVCLSTLRRALKELIKEKIIFAKQGKGNIVLKKTSYLNQPLSGFYKVMETAGEKNVTNLVTEFKIIPATNSIANKLAITTGDLIYSIQRLRLLNRLPILLENSVLAVSLFPALTIAELEKSKFRYIKEQCKIPINDGYRSFEPYLADQEMASLLQLSIGQPLLKISTAVFSDNQLPIEISEQYLVTERYNTKHYFQTVY